MAGSERQYTHHLRKWGVRKQARGAAAIAILAPGGSDDPSGLSRRHHPKKRARPSASTHSFSSVDSAFSRPPRKKVGYDAVAPSKPPCSDILSGDIEEGRVAEKSSWAAPLSSTTTNTADCANRKSWGTSAAGPESVHAASADDFSFPGAIDGVEIPVPLAAMDATTFPLLHLTLQENGSDGQWPSPSISSSREGGTVDPTHKEAPVARLPPSPPAASSPTPARTIRTIDRNRPIETFSAQDIADIKHAAECLSVLCFDQEAFALYATILTPQLVDPTYRDETFWYLVYPVCLHSEHPRARRGYSEHPPS